MEEEIKRVLDMLEEGKITQEEAVNLIKALKESAQSGNVPKQNERFNEKRKIHIVVQKGDRKKVNITIPLSLMKFGLTVAKKLGKSTVNIDGNEIPIDIDKINDILKDPDFSGKIIDVSDDEKDAHVEIEIN